MEIAIRARASSPSEKLEASSSRQFEAMPSEPTTFQLPSKDMPTRKQELLPSTKEEYFAEWDKWATKSDQAPDEKRGEAAKILKAWLTASESKEQFKEQLSLRNLNLTSLPESLSELTSLKELDVSGNQLSKLPRLEKLSSLTRLNVSRNQLSMLRTIPESLTHLIANDNNITEVTNLPPDIVTINLSNNKSLKFASLPESFRNYLKLERRNSAAQYQRLKSINMNDTRVPKVLIDISIDLILNPPLQNEGGGTGGG